MYTPAAMPERSVVVAKNPFGPVHAMVFAPVTVTSIAPLTWPQVAPVVDTSVAVGATMPVPRNPTECRPAAATDAAVPRSAGTVHWPNVLLPQQRTVPSDLSATVWRSPAAIAATLITSTGTSS